MRIKNDYGEKKRADEEFVCALNQKQFVFLHRNKYVSAVCFCIYVPILVSDSVPVLVCVLK